MTHPATLLTESLTIEQPLEQIEAFGTAAAAASSSKEKSWNTLGNVGNASQRNKKQNKQMPVRPRSVNSTFEKRGSKPPLGYATLNNDRTSNRSFQENGSYGSRYVLILKLQCNEPQYSELNPAPILRIC